MECVEKYALQNGQSLKSYFEVCASRGGVVFSKKEVVYRSFTLCLRPEDDAHRRLPLVNSN